MLFVYFERNVMHIERITKQMLVVVDVIVRSSLLVFVCVCMLYVNEVIEQTTRDCATRREMRDANVRREAARDARK